MNIPEITAEQLELLSILCADPNMAVFSQTSPKEGDSPKDIEDMTKGAAHTDALVKLGLVKNISENHKEHLENAKRLSGRNWEVFEITSFGRAIGKAASYPKPN